MSRPALFSEEAFEAALSRTVGSDRWLLVDLTAEWCQPCKQMDRTTWLDPHVVEWVAKHGSAIQIEADIAGKVGASFRSRSVPTIIVFRDGKEVDRTVGGRDAATLLQWLNGLEEGRTLAEQLRSTVDTDHDMNGRMHMALELLNSRRFDEAAREYLWLWENIAKVDPAMTGVRVSFMASHMANLAHEHPPFRANLVGLREQLGTLPEPIGRAARLDWIVLNEVLGESAKTTQWFDRAKSDAASQEEIEHVDHRLIPLLVAAGRWADVGHLYPDPIKHLEQSRKMWLDSIERIPQRPDLPVNLADLHRSHFRKDAGILHRSLRAAGRKVEAKAVRREALKIDGSLAMRAALAGWRRPRGSRRSR